MTVGCDIVHIPRFAQTLSQTPAMRERMFTKSELDNSTPERLAGFFAAKEAVVKAVGTPAGKWQDIEITHESSGRPELKHSLSEQHHCRISISHDGDYAFAVALCEQSPDYSDLRG